ncbi:3'-5' exonuclease [Nocardia nova]|uniref:3'-5' exonuclease n=1 Tax=Nocardia nova TaxID=37330 RepID=UPI0033DB0262
MTAPAEIPAALRGRDIAVVDIEGNGQNPPEIIEIAILSVTGSAVTADDMRSWLVRPEQPITSIVTRKVHHISNKDVADSPPWPEVAPTIQAALDGRILVAHNAKVEHGVIRRHLPGWTPSMVLDTLRLAKKVWPELEGGYGLDKLIAHAALDTTAMKEHGYHRAAYDTWAAWQLLVRLAIDSGMDWPALVAAAAPPEFIPEPEGGLW